MNLESAFHKQMKAIASQSLSKEQAEVAQKIADINKECDRKWGGLKHLDIEAYADKVIQAFIDHKYEVAIVVIDNIHQSRVGELNDKLSSKQLKIPVQIFINFLDGSNASFGSLKKE